MAKTLTQINRQIEALQRKAEILKQREVKGVIDRIQEAIEHYGLTAKDLGLSRGTGASTKAARRTSARKALALKQPAPVKFRDEAGNTWGGRGKRPNWFKEALAAGKSPDDLAA
ncbi:MAG: H-NS histone family protein [Lautropia sp.]